MIRGPSAYVPPGARKTTATRLPSSSNGSPAPSPPPLQAIPRFQEPLVAPAQPASGVPAVKVSPDAPKAGPSLDTSFRQFVSSEKERLTQKRQAAVKAAEKKEQDTRLASLLEFSHSFKVSGAPSLAE